MEGGGGQGDSNLSNCQEYELSGVFELQSFSHSSISGSGNSSHVVFTNLQLDLFAIGSGYQMRFDTFAKGRVFSYTTPFFELIARDLTIVQPLSGNSSGDGVFEQRVAEPLPAVTLRLHVLDFNRAFVGQALKYRIFDQELSIHLPDGMYTVSRLNVELGVGLAKNGNPQDAMRLTVAGGLFFFWGL